MELKCKVGKSVIELLKTTHPIIFHCEKLESAEVVHRAVASILHDVLHDVGYSFANNTLTLFCCLAEHLLLAAKTGDSHVLMSQATSQRSWTRKGFFPPSPVPVFWPPLSLLSQIVHSRAKSQSLSLTF